MAPTTEPERPTYPEARRARTWWWFGSIGAAIALVIGLVWVAGGFEPRTDVRTEVAPGTTISTGPYELTFDRATVQKTRHFSEKRLVWEVVCTAAGEPPVTRPLRPAR